MRSTKAQRRTSNWGINCGKSTRVFGVEEISLYTKAKRCRMMARCQHWVFKYIAANQWTRGWVFQGEGSMIQDIHATVTMSNLATQHHGSGLKRGQPVRFEKKAS